MPEPKAQAHSVSIVIPVYNEQNHIKTCLEAIEQQTVQPLEVIVVDNNCTDKTIELAKKFSPIRVVKEPQQGPVFARNRGFNHARGSIIGRIDADTILPPDWIEQILDFYSQAENKNHAYTGGCYFYNIRLPHLVGWFQGQIAFRTNRLLLGHYITFGSNMALPKSAWRAVRAKTCLRNDIHEDLDLAIHLHQAGYPISYNEDLKVGIKMRRVRSNRDELLENLLLWPQTLKTHNRWTWVFGYVGALLIYCLWPLTVFLEWLARRLGKKPLAD